jgi:hypothetical protein
MLFLSLWLVTTLIAQTTCPRKGIEDCPETGCGGWDKQLDLKKNMVAEPDSLTLVNKDLKDIKAISYPKQWFLGKDRLELKALGEGDPPLGEGTPVQVEAYLIAVRYGDATSANCKLADPKAVDQLLILISEEDALDKKNFGDREMTSVTAQITPRVRRKHSTLQKDKSGNETWGTNWTKRKLDALVGRAPRRALKVRVSGFLLLDTDHIYNPLRRATDWEIHPVLGIEVFCADAKTCKNQGHWIKLGDLVIPDLPRKRPNPPTDFNLIP